MNKKIKNSLEVLTAIKTSKNLKNYSLEELKVLAGFQNKKEFDSFSEAVKEQELVYSPEIIRQLATIELAQRIKTKQPKQIKCTSDAVGYFLPYAEKKVEYFLLLTLDANNKVIKLHEITKGLVNKSLVQPREVFQMALEDNAVNIIVCHNHPSGSLVESVEDMAVTNRLTEAGKIMGIKLLDHLIITKNGHKSII